MSVKRVNFSRKTIQARQTDAEYIRELENSINEMDSRIEEFVGKMDSAIFERKPLPEILKIYSENVSLLTK